MLLLVCLKHTHNILLEEKEEEECWANHHQGPSWWRLYPQELLLWLVASAGVEASEAS